MTGALFLEELAEALRVATKRLAQGKPFERMWAEHLHEDRKAIIALAQTWRDPEPAAAEVSE